MYQLDTSDAILLYYLFCAKIIPALITYLADKLFNVKIKFKSLSLFSASIQNINIKWACYEIVIGEVGLKSKYISSDYKKPLCVNIEDVRVNHLVKENGSAGGDEHETASQEKKVVDDNNNNHKHRENVKWDKYNNKLIQLLWQYLPPTVMMTLKIFQIRIKNFSTTLLNRDKGPMISISIPNLELLFDGYLKRHNRTLSIELELKHIKSKFIPYNKQNPTHKPRAGSLADVVADINVKSEIVWSDGQLIFESQSASLCGALVTFYGGLFDIIEHVMLHTKGGLSSITNADTSSKSNLQSAVAMNESKQESIEKLLDAITPRIISLCAEHIEVKSFDKHSSFHYHLLLHKAVAEIRAKEECKVKGILSNLRIYTPAQEVLFLKELTLDNSQCGHDIKAIIVVDTLDVVYNHEDIYGWWLKILTAGMKSNRRELIMKAIEMGNKKMIEFYHSELVQNLFNQIILHENIELRHVNILLELDEEISCLNATSIHLLMNQSTDEFRETVYSDYSMDLLFKNRHWQIDIISEKLYWFMGAKKLRVPLKIAHVRGCTFYLGNSTTSISSNRRKEGIILNLTALTLNIEYSNKFTKFMEQSAKSLKAYVKLFSQLKKKKISDDNERQSSVDDDGINENLDNSLANISINMEVVDFSLFLVNRHDVCVAVNLASLKSSDNLSYLLEMLTVSTIDYRKDNGSCDISDLTTTYVSTSRLKINLETSVQPQLCVDFAEKLECSWNAHFIRHCLSIARDFGRFKGCLEDALEVEKKQISLPRSLPLGLDIKKLRNISVKHADINVDKLMMLINEVSGENLFFYNYFS